MPRRAVVLMNLGGPDSPEAVRPFLYNLFSDPAIIRLPAPVRLPIAWLVAKRREMTARDIYAQLGGSSPLLVNTEAQAKALEAELGAEYRCFIAMRYWRPLTMTTVAEVKAWQPDEIILLPLYPQFSTTTTASSLSAWRVESRRQNLTAATREIESYPEAPGFIAALAAVLDSMLDRAAPAGSRLRLLFSAHGLPMRIVAAGDPYPQQVALTCEAVIRKLNRSELEWRLCYQSRVGPLAWLGPSVEEELHAAAHDRAAVIVAPVSFVSEHSETLVELDRDYRRIAEQIGVAAYFRAPTVGTDPRFITALAELIRGEAADSR